MIRQEKGVIEKGSAWCLGKRNLICLPRHDLFIHKNLCRLPADA
jgi:hypothetical protein